MLEGMVTLDRSAEIALPDQVYREIRSAIRDGVLQAGEPLPSSRRLAEALKVSRNTVTAAYELLAAEGVIAVRPGAAPRIAGPRGPHHGAKDLSALSAVAAVECFKPTGLSARGLALASERWARPKRVRAGRLEPGTPAMDIFPRDEWARTLRRAARALARDEVTYDQATGLLRFREVLARYLAAERGVRAQPSQILVTPSTQAGLTLTATCLADPGDIAWLEDPGYLGARTAFVGAGLSVAPMPVDAQGGNADEMIARPRPKLLYVTPSHQYPSGVCMSLPRRLAVLEQARRLGGLVIEDDYDSEFLFEGRPVASLQGLSRGGEAIYLGTFAKSLLPGLRVAYMVVPEHLSGPLAAVQRAMGFYASAATQLALADYIEAGHYRAHLRRIRSVYRERGRALAATLRLAAGNRVSVADPVGGIQLSARFGRDVDDLAVAGALNAKGFAVAPLSAYALAADVSGLVIGFADATPPVLEAFAEAIAVCLEDAPTVKDGLRSSPS